MAELRREQFFAEQGVTWERDLSLEQQLRRAEWLPMHRYDSPTIDPR